MDALVAVLPATASETVRLAYQGIEYVPKGPDPRPTQTLGWNLQPSANVTHHLSPYSQQRCSDRLSA